MENLKFPAMFFRIYDRKTASGEITFSRIGISKSAFTALCQNEKIDMTADELSSVLAKMNLSEEETEKLLSAYREWIDA